MKFKAQNLKGYAIIAFSIAYASYTSSLYLEMLLGNLIVSVIAAIALSIIAHLYLMEGIQKLKQSEVNTSIIVGITLCATLAYFDLSGVLEKAEQDTLLPLEQRQTSEIAQIQKQIALVQTTLNTNAQHTEGNKTNWAMYGTFTQSSKQLKALQQELNNVKEKHKEEKVNAQSKAERQQEGLTGLSIALLALSSLVSFTMAEKTTKVSELSSILKVENKPVTSNQQVKTASNKQEINSTQQQASLPEITSTEKQETVEIDYSSLNAQERIILASDYIKQTHETNQRKLSDMFRLNFSHVRQAKIMAGMIATNKSKPQPIGFQRS